MMLARVFTLRFSSMLESFDDEPLREFIKDKEVFSIRDYFFVRNDIPYLAVVITYSMPPQPIAGPDKGDKKRDESWRELVAEKDVPLFNEPESPEGAQSSSPGQAKCRPGFASLCLCKPQRGEIIRYFALTGLRPSDGVVPALRTELLNLAPSVL